MSSAVPSMPATDVKSVVLAAPCGGTRPVHAPGAAPAAAQPVADFYRGKQLRMIIGIEPGTAYDLYARLVTRHMGKYIPGNPTIIPQNMPGAGSLNAYNYIYNVAPKDGTAFGTGHRFVPLMPLLAYFRKSGMMAP